MMMYFRKSHAKGWGLLSVTMLVICIVVPSVTATFSMSVTGEITGWAFNPSGSNENSNTIKLDVSSDNSWIVSVKDALDQDSQGYGKNSSSAGKMLEYNPSTLRWIDTGRSLSANMSVSGQTLSNIAGSSVQLGPVQLPIETGTGSTSGWKEMAVTINQPVSLNDPHLTNGHTYRAIITFIGGETGG